MRESIIHLKASKINNKARAHMGFHICYQHYNTGVIILALQTFSELIGCVNGKTDQPGETLFDQS